MGVLHVGFLTRRGFTDGDGQLLQLVADRICVAIQNARLYDEVQARAHAAQALEFVADGVFLVDRPGLIRLWNPAAETTTGLAAADVLGRRADEAIPGWRALVSRLTIVEAREAHASRVETLPLEVRGRERWLSISAVEFEAGTVFAFRDVTEERDVEKLKSDFVATVSHELRTPLAAIYGAALTLRREDHPLTPSQQSNLLRVISDEAERLARIVNDILWASSLETDTLHIEIESFDGRELAESVVEALRLHLPAQTTLELFVEDDLPPLAGDAEKLRQVLSNLLENAVKYSPDGGPVELRLARGAGGVRFCVSDRGLGIPAREQERIFEKFYRLDPNLTRGVGGTGLGLYISRELVRRMGGRIWVDSRVGEGSTFSVELPVAQP